MTTLHKCVRDGDTVHIVTLCDGEVSCSRVVALNDWHDAVVPAFVASGAVRDRGPESEVWTEVEVE